MTSLATVAARPDELVADDRAADDRAAVRILDLTRRFGETVAVDRLDLAVRDGEIFGLLGPNGAGKTTTIKMLITLLPPTSGTAEVAGFDVRREPVSVRRAIGYVPQLLSADGTLTGRENLDLAARLHHVDRSERGSRIDAALEAFGLTSVGDRLVRQYSGGMIRRLELAEALIHRPRILFLDEPTVGLDPVARASVWDHIRQLAEREATTIVVTTHNMDEADGLCDRVAIMDRGRIAALDTPAVLKASVGLAATLDDVFTAVTGGSLDTGGGFRDVARTRRVARRLG